MGNIKNVASRVGCDRKKASPSGGSCPRSGLMRAKFILLSRSRSASVSPPLIRPCGATFSLRAKSRLRRLRSDTRLRAQPRGGSLRDAKKRTLSRPLSVSKNLPLRDRLPRYGGGGACARGGAVPRRGGGREPCHSPKYFGQPYSSLPHRLRAEPPRRGGQGVSTPFSTVC